MNALQRLLSGESAFVTPESALEDLKAEDARRHPCSAPHSLYEELWHIDFWQHWTLAIVKDQEVTPPLRASDGWPKDNETFTAEAWAELNERFLRELGEVTVLAGSSKLDKRSGDETLRERIETIAGHNAYHLGRMVLLRQLLHLWPPPSGGDTW